MELQEVPGFPRENWHPSSHKIQPEILTRWYGSLFWHFCRALKFWTCRIICFFSYSKATFWSFNQSTRWQILQLWKYANQLHLPILLYFVVRLAAKSKEPVLRRKSSSKITPFRRQFLIQKRFKRPYLGIYVEFFSLCYRNPYRVSQLGSFVLGNSVMLGQPVLPAKYFVYTALPTGITRGYMGL